jgi:hypothetical protein
LDRELMSADRQALDIVDLLDERASLTEGEST